MAAKDPEIIITVDPKGDLTIRTKGFAGNACAFASKFLEAALGRVARDEPTPEMYAARAIAAGAMTTPQHEIKPRA